MSYFTWNEDGLTKDCSSLEAMASRFEESAKLMRRMAKEGFKLNHKENKQLITHKDENIFEGSIISLKRFKEDVQEVTQNYECGIAIDFAKIEDGDIVEAYEQIEESARL